MTRPRHERRVMGMKDLKPLPEGANPNKHSAFGLGLLEDSMQRDGYVAPMTAAADGTILDGNARLEKSADVFADVEPLIVEHDGKRPVVMVRTDIDDADSPMAKRIIVGANRIAQADLAWDAAVLGRLAADDTAIRDFWSPKDLAKLLGATVPADGETAPDSVPAPRQTTIAPGDVLTLGPHRLLCGSSTDAAAVGGLFGGDRADCVFTSPPYGVGIEYDGYEDTIENLRGLIQQMAQQWLSVLVEGGFAVVNFMDIISARGITHTSEPCEYPMALEYWPAFRQRGWTLWSRRIWCKPIARTHSPHCIASNRAASNWEHVWTWKRPGTAAVDYQVVGAYASQNGWLDTSHEASPEIDGETHGASMPVSAALWALSIHARDGSVVYEPFAGTGTTLIAAHQLGRRCYAVEQSPSYCQVIVDRWEAFSGERATAAPR